MTDLKDIRTLLEENRSRLEAFQDSSKTKLSETIEEVSIALKTLERIEQELKVADTRIQERKERINHQQEQLAQIREGGAGIEAKIAGLHTTLIEDQQKITIAERSISDFQSRIESVTNALEKRRGELEVLEQRVRELEQKIGEKRSAKEGALDEQKEQLTLAQKKVEEIRKENPVTDFMLAEGLEPPELDILAILLHKTEASMDELKKAVKVPPAITTRVIKDLEKRGIVVLRGTERVRLAKDL